GDFAVERKDVAVGSESADAGERGGRGGARTLRRAGDGLAAANDGCADEERTAQRAKRVVQDLHVREPRGGGGRRTAEKTPDTLSETYVSRQRGSDATREI